ncbi:hypothetical protein FQA47_005293 [Oryzias melastigma]|uniref:Uncharacterized protein n=1 Tax=Oryzias melastigma TaxID=30732 RepID=A0A834CDU8_ORYME|nr:hypothetical protein FQA47_005293 [Oryzias melastigma]
MIQQQSFLVLFLFKHIFVRFVLFKKIINLTRHKSTNQVHRRKNLDLLETENDLASSEPAQCFLLRHAAETWKLQKLNSRKKLCKSKRRIQKQPKPSKDAEVLEMKDESNQSSV